MVVMSKRTVFVLLAIIGAFLTSIFKYGASGSIRFVTILLLVSAIVALNFGKIDGAKVFFALSFVSSLFYFGLNGLPLSQVIGLAGLALIVVGLFLWNSNKIQSSTLVILGLAVVVFSQYVRVVLLG